MANTLNSQSTITEDTLDISDFEMLISEEDRVAEKDLLKEFALGEYLAHNLAYEAKQRVDGSIIFINELDGATRQYTVQKIDSGHGGLVAEIYKPSGANTTSTVYVNFTGTHNAATLHADVEYCPGEKTFQQNKSRIMSQINTVIGEVASKTQKNVSLICSGHSLGAAYAQQCVAETLRYQAHTLATDPLTQEKMQTAERNLDKYLSSYSNNNPAIDANNNMAKVNQISLMTWNAAGVSKPLQDYTNQMANILMEKKGTKIKARFGMVGGDGVQLSGEGTVLSDCKADVANLKIDKGVEGRNTVLRSLLSGAAMAGAGALLLGPVGAVIGGTMGMLVPPVAGAAGTLGAHMSYHFGNYNYAGADVASEIKYELLRNDTEEGHARIKARLEKKSSVLQTPVAHAGMYFLRKLGDFGAYLKQPFSSSPAPIASTKRKLTN